MLLRSSLSATKKFFKKTLKGFKYFISYQRLPKSPSFKSNPSSFQIPGAIIDPNLSKSIKEMDMFFAEFTQRSDRDAKTAKKRRRETKIVQPRVKSGQEGYVKWGSGKSCEVEIGEELDLEERKANACKGKIEEKLRELEMMDKGNIEHVLDVEEVLHYYSRLTCSAYVAIVDKFFMEIFAEISSMAPGNRSCGRNLATQLD